MKEFLSSCLHENRCYNRGSLGVTVEGEKNMPGNQRQVDMERDDEEMPNSLQDTHSLDSSSSDGAVLRSRTSVRQELQQFIRSTRCQVLVVALVVVDMTLVITELLFDLEMQGGSSPVPFVMHTLSISLLSLFLVEIGLKIYAYRFDFFTRKGDIFDAIVVIVAICLDAVYLHSHDAHSGLGLIIVLRLWRVVPIQKAMVLQVRKVGEKKLLHEQQNRYLAEQEAERYRTYSYSQDMYIKALEELLRRNGISYQEECKNLPDINRISVVAEVNTKE
ncbi:voltage-gated hydrogen channel 1-like [Penaeus japonicus]|uniref:voltage-gated hydrogen channel 1-like n=1 Tax=Penaeus japonicus TaxID=27405 RepID=UPI001C715658|nr:voltage-gated hydrogen channel 1-like [Penaeus japonicus]